MTSSAPKTQRVIRIKARRPGFRRAGVAHAASWVEHPLDRFTAAQLAQLQAEPALETEIATVVVEPAPGGDSDAPNTGGAPPSPAEASAAAGGDTASQAEEAGSQPAAGDQVAGEASEETVTGAEPAANSAKPKPTGKSGKGKK